MSSHRILGDSFDILHRNLFPQEDQPPVPSAFRMDGGNGQIVDAGIEAPRTLQVRVMDQRELPMAGVPVEWLLYGGGQL